MNGRMERAETAIQKLAGENVKLAETSRGVGEKVDAPTDIVRLWYERHGNAAAASFRRNQKFKLA
jgi:hypothetical protein